ncbi:MAG: polysaccharide export protein [Fibrella sp.]|nr:polysaccharide export protein [Armatimonadota bacterium]
MKIAPSWKQDQKVSKKTPRNPYRNTLYISFAVALLVPVSYATAFGQSTTTAPTASEAPAASDAVVTPTYQIFTGDTISIEVFGKPELTRNVTVGVDGKITYPFLGNLKAAGQTVTELGEVLRTGLAKELSNPQVTVTVVKRRIARVGILGAVRQPGKFVMEDGWHVLDLIAESGGLLVDHPEWVQTTLVRASTGTSMPVDLVRLLAAADASENHLLEPGDVLLVREKDAIKTRVQILGAVAKPGLVPAPADGSIVTALLSAGGIIPRAKLSEVVIRRNGESIPVDLTGLGTDGTVKAVPGKPAPSLQPGDTLMIPINGLSYSVIGAVTSPGLREFLPEKNMTAVAALFQAGGGLPNSDLKNASIVRMSATGRPDILPINLEKGTKQNDKNDKESAKYDVALLPGDVLYLPTKKQGRDRMNVVREAMSFLPFAGFFLR